jgi:hypothetical protein
MLNEVEIHKFGPKYASDDEHYLYLPLICRRRV